MFTKNVMRQLWPNARPGVVDAIVTQADDVFDRYGLNTPLRVAHFMAQISHESDGGQINEESLNYSTAARIVEVWPKRFTISSAVPYLHNPRALADKVYNGRMGNAPNSDDGYNYRGRGLLQITGRESYQKMGKATGLPLEDQPELAYNPRHMLEIAAAEFVALGCLKFCDKDDVRGVTVKVNGGTTGLSSRKAWLAKWKLAIPELPGTLPDAPQALAELDAPAPRGADTEPTPITTSNIANGAATGSGLGVAGLVAIVFDKIKEVPDSIMQALVAAAQKPQFWIFVAVVGVGAFIWWKRYRLKHDAGV